MLTSLIPFMFIINRDGDGGGERSRQREILL